VKTTATLLFLIATVTFAQTNPTARVADDAKVIDRVAEAAKKDLPQDLLRRIVNEDIELLRGKRADGSYQYASYDKMEAGRVSNSFSVDPAKKETVLELRGPAVYRLVLSAPSRRMLVTRNKHVYVDRAEIEYIPLNDPGKKYQTSRIGAWIEPGTSKNVEFNEIARQATVRVFTHADEGGYGNLDLTLIEAKLFDDPTSPYADAVSSEKAILNAINHNDIASIRAMAQRIASSLQPNVAPQVAAVPVKPPAGSMEVTAPRADDQIYGELQSIEDLLTGTDAERRQGLDRLHQLVRRLRTTASPHS
jgi:hypothetical protein